MKGDHDDRQGMRRHAVVKNMKIGEGVDEKDDDNMQRGDIQDNILDDDFDDSRNLVCGVAVHVLVSMVHILDHFPRWMNIDYVAVVPFCDAPI